jgi:hypothetical protein
MLAKRAPGYTSLGFSGPRRLALTPSADTDSKPASQALTLRLPLAGFRFLEAGRISVARGCRRSRHVEES